MAAPAPPLPSLTTCLMGKSDWGGRGERLFPPPSRCLKRNRGPPPLAVGVGGWLAAPHKVSETEKPFGRQASAAVPLRKRRALLSHFPDTPGRALVAPPPPVTVFFLFGEEWICTLAFHMHLCSSSSFSTAERRRKVKQTRLRAKGSPPPPSIPPPDTSSY